MLGNIVDQFRIHGYETLALSRCVDRVTRLHCPVCYRFLVLPCFSSIEYTRQYLGFQLGYQ